MNMEQNECPAKEQIFFTLRRDGLCIVNLVQTSMKLQNVFADSRIKA